METTKTETGPVLMDPTLVRQQLRARKERCSDDCRGWDAFDTNEGPQIQLCDECCAMNTFMRDMRDEDVAQLAETIPALEYLTARLSLGRGYNTLPDSYQLIIKPWSLMTGAERRRFVEVYNDRSRDKMDIAHVDSEKLEIWVDPFGVGKLAIAVMGEPTPGNLYADGQRLVVYKGIPNDTHPDPEFWPFLMPYDIECIFLLHRASRDPKLDPRQPGTYFDAYTQAVHQHGYVSKEAQETFAAWATIRFDDAGHAAIAANGREGYTPRPIGDKRPLFEIYPVPGCTHPEDARQQRPSGVRCLHCGVTVTVGRARRKK